VILLRTDISENIIVTKKNCERNGSKRELISELKNGKRIIPQRQPAVSKRFSLVTRAVLMMILFGTI